MGTWLRIVPEWDLIPCLSQISAILQFWHYGNFPPALPKTPARRDNICLIGTYLVPLEPRTLLTKS